MISRWFSFAMSLLFGATSLLSQVTSPPNVLLICVDDLKPTLGCYGDSYAITPHIDALAARGIRFDAAYCNQAVCAPSRHALMTGLRPQTLGIYDLATNFRLARPDAVTMGQAFQSAGYHAEGMGKIYHNGHGNLDDSATWSVPLFRAKAATYANPDTMASRVQDNRGRWRGPATEKTDSDDDVYADGQVASRAVSRLNDFAKDRDQPFFLAVGFVRPHLPFNAPAKYWDQYDSASIPMPAITSAPKDAPSYAATNFGELRNYSDIDAKADITDDETRHLIHGYYAATSYMDAQVGRVMQALDDTGQTENTIVVLWGDHGWHLGDHGMWCKHTNYEQAARIPLIVATPNGPKNKATDAMVETVDLYSTLGELTPITVPDELDGESFAAVLDDPSQAARPFITHVYPRGGRIGIAIRDPQYRLVRWQSFDGEVDQYELYDYQSDPWETTNIAATQADQVAAMSRLIDAQPKPLRQHSTKNQQSVEKSKVAKSASSTPKKPKIDRAKVFTKRDEDRDGFLNMKEFMLGQPDPDKAPARFPKFDKNGDGKLSADEYVRGGK